MTNAPPSGPAVRAEHVGYRYGARQALDDVSFEVPQGVVHGFLGPNGSGKSTLFRLLATILPPQDGQVHVFDHELGASPGAIRRELGVVFQHPALDRKLSVRANLRYAGRLYGLSGADLRRRIDAVLGRAELADRAGDAVGELSGGLRRRVEIAKALLPGPRLLLLDEPSTGLDPAARRALWEFLRGQPQLSVLFTTHLMAEADDADRLTLLDGGRVIVEGTPAELRDQVGGEVLELTTADVPALSREVAAAFDVEARALDTRVRVESPRAHDLVGPLMQRFGDRIERLTLSQPSLEDVFIARTGHRLHDSAAATASAEVAR